MRVSTVCTAFILPVLLSFFAYIAYRYTVRPFPAQAYTLPSPPPLEFNSRLVNATIHSHPLLWAPEDLSAHPTGSWFVTGCYDGQLVRVDPSPSSLTVTPLTYTGYAASLTPALTPLCKEGVHHWLCGRALGLEWRDADTLIVADAYHGLLQWEMPSNRWSVLWNDSIADTNSVVLTKDRSVVYFTSASAQYRNFEVLYSFIAGECTGALLSYSFNTGHVETLLHGLCFPNGILLMNDDTTLVFAETSLAAINTLHLPTRKRSVVLPNLPCMPDNLHWDPAASEVYPTASFYWMGCGGPVRSSRRMSLYDVLGPLPGIRRLMMLAMPWWAVEWTSKVEGMVGMVMRVRVGKDGGHELIDWWMDPKGERVQATVGAMYRKEDGRLWLSSWRKEVHHLASVPWAPPPLPSRIE